MVYECEQCEAALGPGLMECPRCGEAFGEPVPADAVLPENEPPAAPALPPSWERPPEKRRRRRRWTFGRPKITATLAAVLALIGLSWLGYRPARRLLLPAPRPAPLEPSRGQPTDLAAHPAYAPRMTRFVRRLRAAGVGAQWPAFGSNDVILITLPTKVDGKRVAWDKDSYQSLAQGIWKDFAQYRYQSGFSETDTTTCFVIVTDEAGRVAAVDLMGNLD